MGAMSEYQLRQAESLADVICARLPSFGTLSDEAIWEGICELAWAYTDSMRELIFETITERRAN